MQPCIVEQQLDAERSGERVADRELEQLVPQPSAQLDDDGRAGQGAGRQEVGWFAVARRRYVDGASPV